MTQWIAHWRAPVTFGMYGERWHVHAFVIGYTLGCIALGYAGQWL